MKNKRLKATLGAVLVILIVGAGISFWFLSSKEVYDEKQFGKTVITSAEEYEEQDYPLLASLPDKDIFLYADRKNTEYGTLLRVEGEWLPCEEIPIGPRFQLPKLALADYDGDGREELMLVSPAGSGTGVNIERLSIVDIYGEGRITAFEPEDYCAQIEEAVNYSVEILSEDTAILDMRMEGQEISAAFMWDDYRNELDPEEDVHLEKLVWGDVITYEESGGNITMTAAVGAQISIFASPEFIGEFTASVSFDGSSFSLERGGMKLYDEDNPENTDPGIVRGKLYAAGEGIPLDADIAFGYFKEALWRGNITALTYILDLKERGFLEDASYEDLLLSAVQAGDQQARSALKEDKSQFLLPVKWADGKKTAQKFPQGLLKEGELFARSYGNWDYLEKYRAEPNSSMEELLEAVTDAVSNDENMYFDGMRSEMVYLIDFNGDGRNEFVTFIPGGTFGNEDWCVVHLDQEGKIDHVTEEMGMRSQGVITDGTNYLMGDILNNYNDKEIYGYTLRTMDANENVHTIHLLRKTVGTKLVFHDIYDDKVTSLVDKLEKQRQIYIDEYKAYKETVFSKPVVLSEEEKQWFASTPWPPYNFGEFDIDNDGKPEIVGEHLFYPSSAHLSFWQGLSAYSKEDGSLISLDEMLQGTVPFLSERIFPVRFNEMNYFLKLGLAGTGLYVFSIYEIKNGEVNDLAHFLVRALEEVTVYS